MEREGGLRRTKKKETLVDEGRRLRKKERERERGSGLMYLRPSREQWFGPVKNLTRERERERESSSVYNIISRQTGPSLSRAFIPALYVAPERSRHREKDRTMVNGGPWIASDPFVGSFLYMAEGNLRYEHSRRYREKLFIGIIFNNKTTEIFLFFSLTYY